MFELLFHFLFPLFFKINCNNCDPRIFLYERDLFQKCCEKGLYRMYAVFLSFYKHVHLRVAKTLPLPLLLIKAEIETEVEE